MKIVKRVLKFIAVVLGLLIIFIIIILLIDKQNTNYLNIKNNELANNSFLISHVNIIPMSQDTILVDKMVYIKNGIIKSIEDNIEIKGVEIIDAKNKYLTPGLMFMYGINMNLVYIFLMV